jgi:hypothetical protein
MIYKEFLNRNIVINNNILRVVIFCSSVVLILALGFLIGQFYGISKSISPIVMQDTKSSIESTKVKQISLVNQDNTNQFLSYEYQFLQNKFFKNPTSNIFAIEVKPFHKDWICPVNESMYDHEGFIVNCKPKPCSSQPSNNWINRNQSESEQCDKEFESREFQSKSSKITLNASLYELPQNNPDSINNPVQTDISKNLSNKTSNGIPYEVNKSDNGPTSALKEYTYTLYSPFILSSVFSNYSGTFYGSDLKKARYTINFKIYGETITDEQVSNLAESFIDNINFIKPVN